MTWESDLDVIGFHKEMKSPVIPVEVKGSRGQIPLLSTDKYKLYYDAGLSCGLNFVYKFNISWLKSVRHKRQKVGYSKYLSRDFTVTLSS